jgi:hypothetical protein
LCAAPLRSGAPKLFLLYSGLLFVELLNNKAVSGTFAKTRNNDDLPQRCNSAALREKRK